MKANFLDYVAAFEDVHNPTVAPRISTVQEAYIYSYNEGTSHTFMLERQTDMYMNERLAQEFLTFQASVKSSGTATNVLWWYQEIQLQFHMLALLSTMIFDILHSQAENERGFLFLVCLHE